MLMTVKGLRKHIQNLQNYYILLGRKRLAKSDFVIRNAPKKIVYYTYLYYALKSPKSRWWMTVHLLRPVYVRKIQ